MGSWRSPVWLERSGVHSIPRGTVPSPNHRTLDLRQRTPVQLLVSARGAVPGEVALHAVAHQAAPRRAVAPEVQGLVEGPDEGGAVGHVETEAGAVPRDGVVRRDRVHEPSRGAHDGNGAVAQAV